MTTRMDGFRKRTRRKFKKNQSDKGKLSIRSYLQKLNTGDKVALIVEPAYQRGMYRPKFLGKVGIITGVKGQCYQVEISDFSKKKTLIVHPIHLKKLS
ncbi:TPA: 50S ribosomal protein L21e [Candidatus Woesearchaeota archaeon]|nr:50S ribosomal protein L21e [Candidatus Woesearchaeota archaeon]HIH31132.1 50S ribosomal protein L21e [Candidatus Woesearchaeota archaeon]HIH54613.1 50S ribosomal protein L21e [Candidatus Woesearchaeota archaeon]HIJ02333.1 50S ribosomal protein L21e [Candidatus Woesearchaeota archaeon]HIJ14189.1 50S ribosomal protein L21e [Candidatus Woesearchaeota archaeon]